MSTSAQWGWRILVAVSALLVLNGVALYLFIVDTHTEQTIGVVLTGFSVCALSVAVEGLRRGSRWAWNTMWTLVATLAAIGLHALRADRFDLVLLYLVAAAVALVGQFIAGRGLES